jgi:hypothetical protein
VAFGDGAVESGVGPLLDAADKAVFYRVEMNIVHVAGEVVFVSDGVFPETALPDVAFALLVA